MPPDPIEVKVETTLTLATVVGSAYSRVHEETVPITFGEAIVAEAARLLVEDATSRDLVTDARTLAREELRSALAPLIQQALSEALPAVSRDGTTLGQLVVLTAKKELTRNEGGPRGVLGRVETTIERLIREEVGVALRTELKADLDAAKEEVRVAVRQAGATVLQETIDRMAAR